MRSDVELSIVSSNIRASGNGDVAKLKLSIFSVDRLNIEDHEFSQIGLGADGAEGEVPISGGVDLSGGEGPWIEDVQLVGDLVDKYEWREATELRRQARGEAHQVVLADGRHFDGVRELVSVNVALSVVRDEFFRLVVANGHDLLKELDKLLAMRQRVEIKVQAVGAFLDAKRVRVRRMVQDDLL